MSALRLILLGAGLLFLALLAWLGSRRPRRVQPDDEGTGAPGARESSMPARGEPLAADGDALVARRTAATPASLESLGPMTSSPGPAASSPLEPSIPPPVVDWSEAAAEAQAAEAAAAAGAPHATLIEVPVMSSAPEARRGPPRGTAPAATAMPASAATDSGPGGAFQGVATTGSPGAGAAMAGTAAPAAPEWPAPAAPRSTPGAEPELYVAWPPEAERHIVSLRVLGLRGDRIPGRLLRQGLAATGFRHGPFGIYHVGHDDGRVLISAASLVRPGLLDPENMDFQHFPGVNLFAVLPAPLAPAELLDRFCAAAFDLAERIDGSVQDEGGAPLGVHESQDWRARCIAAFAQHAGAL